MTKQNLEYINLNELELDIDNPRLPTTFRKKRLTKKDIINWMLNDASIIELMLAIGQSGFFVGEALLVVKNEKGKYVVVEGNRRLTSTILLSEPELANIHKKKIDKVLNETDSRPKEIPCIVFENKEEITKYLGYRHVTGIKSWGILAKAKYLNELKKELIGLDLSQQCRELAKSIGSKSDYVKKLLVAYELYEIIEDEGFYKIKDLDETNIYFNYFSDSLSRDHIRSFMGVDMKSERPTESVNKDNLKKLTHWFFEKNENQKTRLKGDSSHLGMLDKVISDPESFEYFSTGSGSITEAYNICTVTADSYNQDIEIALSALKRSNGIIHNVEEHHAAVEVKLKEIFNLAKNMKVIIEATKKGGWDD